MQQQMINTISRISRRAPSVIPTIAPMVNCVLLSGSGVGVGVGVGCGIGSGVSGKGDA